MMGLMPLVLLAKLAQLSLIMSQVQCWPFLATTSKVEARRVSLWNASRRNHLGALSLLLQMLESMCVHSGPVLPIVQQRTVSHGTEMISNMSKACRRQVRVVVTRMMLATCGLVRRGTIGFAWNFQRFRVKWPGEDKWISWRGKQDHISATYSENDAMYVSLEWARMHDQANTVKSSLQA